ncbi:MAG: 3D domain-containing protein [Nanoarchaeota archaeon]|jgi:3D (Asp-Asp-Asp) domain-containing protein|nr:3D domain-containing protein [Nanoarchaeota archaeon]
MKVNKKEMKEKFKAGFIIIVVLAIGISYTVCYYEGKELKNDYTSSMTIINEHFENKEINIESKDNGVAVEEASAQVMPSEEGRDNGASGTASLSEEIGEFTSYSAGDGFTPGIIMASGKEVYEGAIACPARLDFGTEIEVNGNTYTCEDRMAKRFRDGNYFDIYQDNQDESLEFGRRQLAFIIK